MLLTLNLNGPIKIILPVIMIGFFVCNDHGTFGWTSSCFATPVTSKVETTDFKKEEIEALRFDLETIVYGQERVDWLIDQYSLDLIMPRVLEAVCHGPSELSSLLIEQLEREVRENGTAKALWLTLQKKGEEPTLLDIEPSLSRERVLLVLKHAQSERDKCPFWMKHRTPYYGRHRDDGGWQILLESMAGGQLVWTDDFNLGLSGQGRLIPIFSGTHRWAFGIGIEVGGASTFPLDESGQRTVKAMWTTGVPFLLRYWWGHFRVDSEVSPVVRFLDGEIFAPKLAETLVGMRLAQSIGFSTIRVAGFLPHFMLWAGYEHYFTATQDQVLRVGTRVGVSWGGVD